VDGTASTKCNHGGVGISERLPIPLHDRDTVTQTALEINNWVDQLEMSNNGLAMDLQLRCHARFTCLYIRITGPMNGLAELAYMDFVTFP
jgi:hypothetical protein